MPISGRAGSATAFREGVDTYRPQHQAHTHAMEHGHHVHGKGHIRQVSLTVEGDHAKQRQPVKGIQHWLGECSRSYMMDQYGPLYAA